MASPTGNTIQPEESFSYLPPAPPYTCCFPSKAHPQMPEIVLHVQSYFNDNWSWTSDVEKAWYPRQDLERCSSYIIPEAPLDRAITVSLWYTLIFLLDDQIEALSAAEKARKATDVLQGLMRGTKLPDQASKLQRIVYKVHRGFVDVEDAESQALGEAVLQEGVKWMKCAMQAAVRNKDYKPKSFEEFIVWRKGTLGTWVFLYTLRWAYKIHLPQHILESASVRQFEDKAITHTLFVNDLYSYRKEVKEAEEAGIPVSELGFDNAIVYFMRGRQMTEGEAIEEMLKCLREAEVAVLSAVDQLYAKFEGDADSEELQRYVEGVLLTLGGHVAWSSFAGRYNKTPKGLKHSLIGEWQGTDS